MTNERPVGWGIESMRYHGPNVVICKLATRLIWTPLFNVYLPPSMLEHLPDLEEALKRFREPIFLGDLNMDLDDERIPRRKQVSDLLTEYGIIDLVLQFHQHRRFRNLNTWSQLQ